MRAEVEQSRTVLSQYGPLDELPFPPEWQAALAGSGGSMLYKSAEALVDAGVPLHLRGRFWIKLLDDHVTPPVSIEVCCAAGPLMHPEGGSERASKKNIVHGSGVRESH